MFRVCLLSLRYYLPFATTVYGRVFSLMHTLFSEGVKRLQLSALSLPLTNDAGGNLSLYALHAGHDLPSLASRFASGYCTQESFSTTTSPLSRCRECRECRELQKKLCTKRQSEDKTKDRTKDRERATGNGLVAKRYPEQLQSLAEYAERRTLPPYLGVVVVDYESWSTNERCICFVDKKIRVVRCAVRQAKLSQSRRVVSIVLVLIVVLVCFLLLFYPAALCG